MNFGNNLGSQQQFNSANNNFGYPRSMPPPWAWTNLQPNPFTTTNFSTPATTPHNSLYGLPYQTIYPIVQNPPNLHPTFPTGMTWNTEHGRNTNYGPSEPAYIIAKIPVLPVAKPMTMKAKPKPPLNSAIERRRRSIDYKRKQFKLKRLQVRERKKTIGERRLEQLTQKVIKRDRESLFPIYVRKRQKRYTECPLETCPKKILGNKARRRTLNRDSDDSFFSSDTASVASRMSHGSKRSRSPILISRHQCHK